jgi:hypothetical protein
MTPIQPSRRFRLLLIEDDIGRVEELRAWCPAWVHLVWAQSAGAALGLIRRDPGRVYGGILLDHDLQQRAKTEDDLTLSGTQVALALIAHVSSDVPILIHSTNQIAITPIVQQLEGQGFWVTRIPFYHLTEERFLAWLEEARELWEDGADQ